VALRSILGWTLAAIGAGAALGQNAPRPPIGPYLETAAQEPLESTPDPIRSVPIDRTPAATSPSGAVATPSELPPGEEPIPDTVEQQAIHEDSIESRMARGEVGSDGWPGCTIGDFTFDFPKWYVRSDAMWLDRTRQGELTTATIREPNGGLGNYRIDASTFSITPGMRVFVGRNILDGMSYLELGYTGLFRWESERFLGVGTDFAIVDPNLNLGLVDMGFSTNQDPERQFVGYSAFYNDGEINLRSFMSPNFAMIFGIRYIGMNEDLLIVESGTTTTAQLPFASFPYQASRDASVENGLLTAQMGADLYFDLFEDVRLNLLGKIGLAANFSKSIIRQAAQVSTVQGAAIAADSRVQVDDETVLSGVLDAGAGLDVRLTRNLVLFGGYHFMCLHNVAVATEQVPNAITDPNGIQRQIENGATVFLYGPYVGLQISWGGVD
jgi:hypothetical protein